MPRRARQFGEFGYLHIITRGVGKQILFEDDQDYYFYLKILKHYSIETGVSVIAYCLMENHVHLLVYDLNSKISSLMKKLGVSYSQYYNTKYERNGHLFQDRYRSEIVEDERYLLTVFRYILKNPEKAGICPAGNYKWSSYSLYESGSFVRTDIIRSLIGGLEDYKSFISSNEDDQCMEANVSIHGDNWARKIIKDKLNVESGTVLQSFDKKRRDDAIGILKRNGLSVRQIERLTGINRGIISRV